MDAITCNNIGICFAHGSQRALLSRSLRRALFGKDSRPILSSRPSSATEFWALRNISFSILRGTSLGLCGMNGSGKTTLMRIISGIYGPDEGSVATAGRTSALLSLGVGMSASLSGRENLQVVGALHGLSQVELQDRYERIRSFAELDEETMRTPVRYYSSGMRTRLGFAIYSVVTPEILLIDEVLAVGDAAFRAKSAARLREISSGAQCVVVSSHNLGFLKDNCEMGIWLHEGRILATGPMGQVLDEYTKFLKER